MACARRLIAMVTIAAVMVSASPSRAAVDCLTDAEILTIVRSVYTRAIGRVMRICADSYPNLDIRAINATTEFLSAYAEQMRRNRTSANELMSRIYENWEYAFAQLLADGTVGDEVWAQGASERDCLGEVERVEDLVTLGNYERAMTNDRTERQFATERALVPECR